MDQGQGEDHAQVGGGGHGHLSKVF
jgi:hypothetical protein